jgi:hypothetical protein
MLTLERQLVLLGSGGSSVHSVLEKLTSLIFQTFALLPSNPGALLQVLKDFRPANNFQQQQQKGQPCSQLG